MKAIFIIGGQQYFAGVNDELYVQKLDAPAGSVVQFDQVLMLDGQVGTPTIAHASVECEVIKHGKQPKIEVVKFISQKHHMKKQGHRQQYTKLLVKNIKK